MINWLCAFCTLIMFPFAFLSVGFDIAKAFIEFHMKD